MTQFMPGDIVTIELSSFNRYHDKVKGHEALLLNKVEKSDPIYNAKDEKWFFKMLEGPMRDHQQRMCIPSSFLKLKRPAVDSRQLTKGLPHI